MPIPPCIRGLLYAWLLLGGLTFLTFAGYQHLYSRTVAAGNQAVAEQRFDSQAYERASHFWLAHREALLFNQGVLAYKAGNLPHAADYFRQAAQDTTNPTLRMHAQYNLGLVMLALEEVEKAAEFFKSALRLDTQDAEAKFNLERLYHFVLRQEGEHGEAALKQAPGVRSEQDHGLRGDGQGRSKSPPGI
jgi:tetratricopeptide (TPR) repeat protein